jgi:ribonucleoside-triphosphate reductase
MTNSNEVTLPTQYQQFIHKSRYARWLEEEGRRETWNETVDRYIRFMCYNKDGSPLIAEQEITEIRDAILHLKILPSMRAMMTAGPALELTNVAGYNCAYTPVDKPIRFAEILYILMCGTGIGFSCEASEIDSLPKVPEILGHFNKCLVVEDSKEGWASAYRELVTHLFNGEVCQFDLSNLRPKGARLKTFGGRSSGPEPLKELFEFTIETFRQAAGRKLKPIEVHDIVCKIGEVVVVGGVRRSAEISLSDLSDKSMANAKGNFEVNEFHVSNQEVDSGNVTASIWYTDASGKPGYLKDLVVDSWSWGKIEDTMTIPWYFCQKQRALANNSAVYESKPSIGEFMDEWVSLYKSGSGERGIFSRAAARMLNERVGRKNDVKHGTNPCSEIILRPQQFCNLTEVVVRPSDTVETLANKVRLATILGTLQARLTNFPFLSPEWKETTEKEALLGVSMTGIYDGPTLTDEELTYLRSVSEQTNNVYSSRIGINRSAARTCVKPSGTASQLVDAASGIHARHSQFYIRRVRGDTKDPLTQLLIAESVPNEPCAMKPDQTVVFSFPIGTHGKITTREDVDAIAHLEKWLQYQKYWCDHKPSVTISVREDEWLKVGAWVYENFEWMSGVSFLPYAGGSYMQAPYEEIDAFQWQEMKKTFPHINWYRLAEFEKSDNTAGSQTLACTGGVCEIVDIGTNE